MATYNQVSYGSKGSDVTELQKLLNNNGYNLKVDGDFGSKTQDAVKDYQKKNNLVMDGIVGNKTWGALTNTSPSSGSTSSTGNTTNTVKSGFNYGAYTEGDSVTEAQKMLQDQLAKKPIDYKSQWGDQLKEIYDKILNREKFSYDLNGDALYQQYKNQYVQQGKMSMMDTMGQAQAMTGGYGNSYAQSVGQQAYQGHLQELNNKIPELYQLALNQYQMEGDEMYNQAALMAQQEEQDYGRYRDQVGDWQTERNYRTDRYESERDYDYGKWADGRDFEYNKYSDDRAYNYQTERDKISDKQWQKEFDEAKRQFDKQMAKSSSSYSKSSGRSSSKSSGSSSSKSSSSYTKNPSLTKAEILSIQKQAGLTQDGIWGPKTAAAYDKGYRPETDNPEPKKKTLTPYAQLTKDLDAIIAGMDSRGLKVTKSEVSNVIREAQKNGEITQQQAQQLLTKYTPRGYTY